MKAMNLAYIIADLNPSVKPKGTAPPENGNRRGAQKWNLEK